MQIRFAMPEPDRPEFLRRLKTMSEGTADCGAVGMDLTDQTPTHPDKIITPYHFSELRCHSKFLPSDFSLLRLFGFKIAQGFSPEICHKIRENATYYRYCPNSSRPGRRLLPTCRGLRFRALFAAWPRGIIDRGSNLSGM